MSYDSKTPPGIQPVVVVGSGNVGPVSSRIATVHLGDDGAVSAGSGWYFVSPTPSGTSGTPPTTSPNGVPSKILPNTGTTAGDLKCTGYVSQQPATPANACAPSPVKAGASASGDNKDPTETSIPAKMTTKSPLKMALAHLARAGGGRGGKGGARKRGFKPITLELTAPFSLTSAGSGAFSPTVALAADGNTNDWNALLSLYDEYKCSRIKIEWGNYNVNGTNINSPMVVGFDQADGTALSSVAAGATLTHHLLTGPTGIYSNNIFTYAKQNGKMYALDVKLKADTALAVSSGVGSIVAMPDTWTILAAAGANIPLGWLRTYSTTTLGSGVVVLAGVIRYTCQFRSRE